MKIRILAFGIAKDILGGTSAEIEYDGALVEDLRRSLGEKYPELKQLSSFMIAVNNEYADGNRLINGDEEIAIIPPVSGG